MQSASLSKSFSINTADHAIDVDALRQNADRAVSALRLLANKDRLLLLCQLTQGEMCVSDLEAQLNIRQPTLSQQLGVLRSEGLSVPAARAKTYFMALLIRPCSKFSSCCIGSIAKRIHDVDRLGHVHTMVGACRWGADRHCGRDVCAAQRPNCRSAASSAAC